MSWLGRFRTVRARILSHRTKSEPIANTPPGGESFVVEGLGEDLGVTLQLDDIDWVNGQFAVRSKKGDGWARLPLPVDVGRALARYLKVRPPSACRNVFVRGYAPFTPFSASGPVSVLVRKAIETAKVKSARTGAHVFRHSLATEMLRRGASLDEIGRVLRHKDPDSTAIYAKVDLNALRKLALPWPGGAQ